MPRICALLFSLVFCLNTSIASAETLVNFTESGVNLSLIDSQDGLRVSLSSLKNKQIQPSSVFELQSPPRLVLDVPGFNLVRSHVLNVRHSSVKSVRLGVHPGKARIVVDFKGSAVPKFAVHNTNAGRAFNISLATKGSIPSSAPVVAKTRKITPIKKAPAQPKKLAKKKPKVAPKLASLETTPEEVWGSKVDRNQPPKHSQVEVLKAPSISLPGSEEVSEPPAAGKQLASMKSEAPVIDPPSPSNASVKGLSFKKSNGKTPVPALLVDVEHLGGYSFSKKGTAKYELKLERTSLSDKRFELPRFPPDEFIGFQVVQAKQRNKDVLITIDVDDGTRLSPFRKRGQLWVKVLQ